MAFSQLLPSPSSPYLTHHKNPTLNLSFSPSNFTSTPLPHPNSHHRRHHRHRKLTSTATVHCQSEKHETNIPPQNDVVELPLFPLPLVLFPGAILPLQIFEYRYRIMMHTLLQTDLRFGVIYTDATTGTADVGCVGEVVKHERLVDDRFFIICKGQERFRVTRIVRTKPYLVAEVVWLEDRPSGNGEEDLEGLASEVESHMKDVIRLSNRLNGKPEKEAGDLRRNLFPTPFSFFVGSTFEGAPREQQALLELEDTMVRLKREKETLRNTLNYLSAASAVKDVFPSSSS
ncbi:putative endopeptidase La [Helianthus annuus]|uniref:Endopeptidase La n=1 Tax=Helianthus annuus TaxID=4232 RepID=A0A9K3J2Q8_HELAN|nr:lon protease 2-like [Helianthus annuus]KAF5806680.1 putative endopeptidase La [Helianthus annuus]KAJ0585270.1 putative endopeptidase La [Helianthus annuus]KAJ0919767.1 putative endopeptidase La [Helianthus annuus]